VTETTTPVEEQTSAIQAGDLGKQLIACREKAGLDLEQAADEMHLSTSLLRSLEKEEFARLPEPPYVRGYLRGYAKFADIDPKELIRTYEALRGANPDEIAHHFAPARSLNRVAQQPTISPTLVKLLGIGLVLLGLVMVSLIPGVREWTSSTWTSFSAQTAPAPVVRPTPALEAFTAQKDAEEKSVATPATTPASDAEPTLATTSSSTPETTATASTDTAATTPTTTASSDTDATSVTAASSTQDTAATDSTTVSPATPATATTPDAATTAATSPAATAGDSATATTSPTATTAATSETTAATTNDSEGTTEVKPIAGEVNIKLEFTEDVWMQIKDNGKKTLHEALSSAGSTKELKATTPLNFKVGNARGVKIYLNGQLYDQAPHTKGSVSRFKVE